MARKALGAASLKVVNAVKTQLPPVQRVRVACSGGADSMALALGANWVTERTGQALEAMIVDHGLQPGSAEIATEAAARLAEFGIDSRIVRVDVNPAGIGMEAGARLARYAALQGQWNGGELPDIVLIGHTLDDQAETVLLGLARGSGTRSLAGMPASWHDSVNFLRPLLEIRRTETRAACEEWGVAFWDDPHNEDERFLRSEIRAKVLPVLSEVLGESVPEALARTAFLARQDADALDDWAANWLSRESSAELEVKELLLLPVAIQSRVIRSWLGGELSFTHTQSVLELIHDWHGQAGVDLPGVSVRRESGRLRRVTTD